MATEIRVPALGESVTEATIGQWTKKEGDSVAADEVLVDLETDKVSVEVRAPAAGRLARIAARTGETVQVGGVIGAIEEGAAAKPSPPARGETATRPAGTPAGPAEAPAKLEGQGPLSPAVRKMVEERKVDPDKIAGTGKDGRITKGDVIEHLARPAPPAPPPAMAPATMRAPMAVDDAAREERVRMSRLRQTIARRLKDAQMTAAMLTTFNEVDMSAVMGLRSTYKEAFEKKHGIKLGFMSFFVKAVVAALKEIPDVNAEVDGEDIVYKNYYHIGVAVGTDKGLVVPVLRDCDRLSFAEIEKAIADYGRKAREGSLQIADMQGGTFTISNGGVYGSLMSTPILNAPQSGILGMHKIEDRPVAIGGQVAIRPMMYLALSYDHRIVDGREAVTFLVRVKEGLEDPQRALLDL